MPLSSTERSRRHREKKRQEAETVKQAQAEATNQVYELGQKVLSDPPI